MKKELYHEAMDWWENKLDGKQRNAIKIEAYINYVILLSNKMEAFHK